MDATTLTTAILTHPFQLVTIAVAIGYAVGAIFSARREDSAGRPLSEGSADPIHRQAA